MHTVLLEIFHGIVITASWTRWIAISDLCLYLFFRDFHLLVQIQIDNAIFDLTLGDCVFLKSPFDDHLPGFLILAKFTDEFLCFYAEQHGICCQTADCCGVVSVIDDIFVSKHLTNAHLRESHCCIQMGFSFEWLFDNCFFF